MIEQRWITFESFDLAEVANYHGFEVLPSGLKLRPFKVFATSEEYLQLREEAVNGNSNS